MSEVTDLVKKVQNLNLTAEEAFLREQGLKDSEGNLTAEAKSLLINHLWEENKAGVIAKVKKVIAAEAKK